MATQQYRKVELGVAWGSGSTGKGLGTWTIELVLIPMDTADEQIEQIAQRIFDDLYPQPDAIAQYWLISEGDGLPLNERGEPLAQDSKAT